MASQSINHISGAAEQETSTIEVGASENVAVRLSRYDDDSRALLKITGNGVTSYEPLYQNNTIFDAVPAGHDVSVITRRPIEGGGVEGVLETYT